MNEDYYSVCLSFSWAWLEASHFSICCFLFSFACLHAYLSVCSIQVAAVCWLAPTLSYLPLVGPGAKRFIKFRASTARLLFFCGANLCWEDTQTRGSRSRSKGGDKRARHKTRPTRINEIIYGIMWNKVFFSNERDGKKYFIALRNVPPPSKTRSRRDQWTTGEEDR